jgi:hypothetical protein
MKNNGIPLPYFRCHDLTALILVAATLCCVVGTEGAAQNQPNIPVPGLVQAVKNKQYAAISVLLKQKTNVDVRDGTGRTALMWAAYQSDSRAVSVLRKHKAKVNLQDKEGLFALWIATERGDIAISTGAEVEIVRRLLQDGAMADLKNKNGDTIFGLIAEMERPDPKIVRLLRQARSRHHRHRMATPPRIASIWAL